MHDRGSTGDAGTFQGFYGAPSHLAQPLGSQRTGVAEPHENNALSRKTPQRMKNRNPIQLSGNLAALNKRHNGALEKLVDTCQKGVPQGVVFTAANQQRRTGKRCIIGSLY